MSSQPLSFRWDAEFVARIDQVRGLVPRSTFVRAAVEDALAEHEGTVSSVALGAVFSGGNTGSSRPRHSVTCRCAMCKPPKAKS
jgi:hypothetical protein